MFSRALEESLNRAFEHVSQYGHQHASIEHLLLALLDNVEAKEVLIACGGNTEALRAGLSIYLETQSRSAPASSPNSPQNPQVSEDPAYYVPPDLCQGNEIPSAYTHASDPQPTEGFQRVLHRAMFQVNSVGRIEITGADVLASILCEISSEAVHFMTQENISRIDVINYITHGMNQGFSPQVPPPMPMGQVSDEEEFSGFGQPSMGDSPLQKYTINLNERAKSDKIDPLIGRAKEVERAAQVLCRRRKNNPLLVGEPGVGKTAIAEGLALKIVSGEVPEVLSACVICSLDMGAMLAGTKYRGDFEKRFKLLLKDLLNHPNHILFIDEIHILVGAGAASGGAIDAANLIKPALTSGEVRCIGATTYEEYRNLFLKDRALARRFQKLDIVETSVEDTFKILKGLRSRLEAYHGVKFSLKALKLAVTLSKRYMTNRYLPDKALDVVDEAGAKERLKGASQRKKTIGPHEIEQTVADIAHVPAEHISRGERDVLKTLSRNLKVMIYGQDEAIASLSSAIQLARSGLREEDKPVGSFLFMGPTGVGKTEVVRQLAKQLSVQLVRFDMSEYMEQHTVSRLIGAPPGYVGYDQGGLLTEEIIKNPYCVLLLDEIEKAHPDVYNVLLQIMDYGTLTDNNGRKADFKHVIVVMTSNTGAQVLEKNTMGFMAQDHDSEAVHAMKQVFSPEFRNRLDGIIQFKHLTESVVRKVVDKLIMELQVQLEAKQVYLRLDDRVVPWLCEHGYDKQMGARPMARLIQDKIKKELATHLLFGDLQHGGDVLVTVENKELALKCRTKKQLKASESE